MKDIEDLPYVNLADPRFASDPVRFLREAAALAPVVRTNRGLWVLDGDVHDQLARDRRLENTHAGELVHTVGLREGGPAYRFRSEMLLAQHGRGHAALRAVVSAYFSPAGIEQLRGHIREIIDDLLLACPPDRPIQFFDDVASKVPALLFCRMASMPESDAPFVTRISDTVLQIFARDPALAGEIEAGYDELFTYVTDLIARRRQDVGDDLLSLLIRAQDNGRMNEQQVYDMVVMLLEASTDNTSNQMAMAVAEILADREQFDILRAHPEKAPNAAAEGVRVKPRVLLLRRSTIEAYEIHDIEIPAGTELVLPVLMSHFSEQQYGNPDTFDVTRDPGRPLLTFGGGPHRCLGGALATLEIEEMLLALTQRYPHARLAGDVEIRNNGEVQFVTSLPVIAGERAAVQVTV